MYHFKALLGQEQGQAFGVPAAHPRAPGGGGYSLYSDDRDDRHIFRASCNR